MAPNLFLSYNRADSAVVMAISSELKRAGIATFLDTEDLSPGYPWQKELASALASADAVAVFLGRHGLKGWQMREVYRALDRQVKDEESGRTFPVIPVLLPGCEEIPSFFVIDSTWIDLREGMRSRGTLDRLVRAVFQARPEEAESAGEESAAPMQAEIMAICPYRGLSPFREEDSALFFGRGAFIQRLLERVNSDTFVAVVGSSGSGKSSVIQAGLIPALRRQLEPAWEILTVNPARDPFSQLARGLVPLLEPLPKLRLLREVKTLANDFRAGELNLSDVVDEALEALPGTRIALIVDQFEEVFTLEGEQFGPAEVGLFVESLLEARRSKGLTVVLVLRSDFYGHAVALSGNLSNLLEEGRLLHLRAMDPGERRQAIEEPARRVGLKFEAGLVERILDQMGDEAGQLPLLGDALQELWHRRSGQVVTHAAYDALGELSGAITRRAQAAFDQLSEDERTIAKYLFIRMVHVTQSGVGVNYTTQPISLGDLSKKQRQIVKMLADAKLLITSSDASEGEREIGSGSDEMEAYGVGSGKMTGRETVTLVHEALIEGWEQLRRWLEENSQFLLWQQRTTTLSEDWKRHRRKREFLLRKARLAEAEIWLERRLDLGEELRKFIRASHRWHMVRGMASWTGLLVLLATASYAWLWLRKQQDLDSYQRRYNAAERLTAEAKRISNEDGDAFQMSLLLDIEALRQFEALGATSPEADRGLRHGLALLSRPITHGLAHRGRVLSVLFSSNGRYLATMDQSDAARVWEVSTNREIVEARHEGAVNAIDLSNDGKYLATGSQDHTARIWDSRNGSEIHRFVHDAVVTSVAFDAEALHLATTSSDKTARIWEVASGREVARFEHDDEVLMVSYDSLGDRIATVSLDGAAHVWNVITGTETLRLNYAEPISIAIFSPAGRYVATVCADYVVRVSDARTGRELAQVRHEQPVSAIAFSPDGKDLATASFDGSARLWDVLTGREIARFNHQGPVNDLVFSRTGSFLATASHDRTARVWEVRRGREVTRACHRDIVYAVSFGGDGDVFATGSFDKTARVWSALGSTRLLPLVHSHWVRDVAFDPTGTLLATAGFDSAVHLWNVTAKSSSKIRQFGGWSVVRKYLHNSAVTSVAFSPDGQILASADLGGAVNLSRVTDGRQIRELKHSGAVEKVVFNSNGRKVGTAGHDGTARIWDTGTGKELVRIQHRNRVLDMEFSPDGTLVVTASKDGALRLWESDTGSKLQDIPRRTALRTVAFSPDGKFLAAAGDNKSIQIWRLTERRRLSDRRVLVRVAHNREIYDLAFSPQGEYIASGSGDGTAKLWKIDTGEQVTQMDHKESVRALAFSADGRTLATASEDHTVRLWPLSPEDLIREVCAGITLRLEPKNWPIYFGKEPYREICPEQGGGL